MRLVRFAAILISASILAYGQQPAISTVQNAASMAESATRIAPQMLVAIKGQSLAATPATATLPWPKQLAGTTVTFNGTLAALYYVSPTQINAVVPSALQGSANATIVVTTAAGASAPLTVTVATSALGIFTQNMSGCGQLSAYNIHADGSLGLNTPQNSLDPINDYGLAIWLTGLGAFADRTDGAPWQYNGSDNLARSASLVLGIPNLPNASSLLEPMAVTYAGPAPGLSGVDQVNATFPSTAAIGRGQVRHQGCNVPLYFTDNVTSASQLVSVSIRDGGGACVDPAAKGMATINWQKSFINDAPGSSDSVFAIFLQGADINFPEPGLSSEIQYASNLPPQPSVCIASYPKTLDVGEITLRGPVSRTLTAANSGGIVNYLASLQGGAITGGTYQVSGNGFSDSETIPAPIAITTNLQPGAKVPGALTVNWTGGTTQSVVTVQLLVRAAGSTTPSFVASQSVLASAGAVSFPGFTAPQVPYPTGSVEVTVTQRRAVGTPAAFAIPGFSLGGEQTWSYAWDFRGLSN